MLCLHSFFMVTRFFICCKLWLQEKGRILGTLIVSLALSPLIGIIYVACSKELKTEQRENEIYNLQKKHLQKQTSVSVADEIDKLQKLKESGSISHEEFDKLKAKLF